MAIDVDEERSSTSAFILKMILTFVCSIYRHFILFLIFLNSSKAQCNEKQKNMLERDPLRARTQSICTTCFQSIEINQQIQKWSINFPNI